MELETLVPNPIIMKDDELFCLLCFQQFRSPTTVVEAVADVEAEDTKLLRSPNLALNLLTPVLFPILRKIPKKILSPALQIANFCSNCAESLNKIHNVQESIRQLQSELEELGNNFNARIMEQYGNLEELPSFDREGIDVRELRRYFYQASASSASKKYVKNQPKDKKPEVCVIPRRLHKSNLRKKNIISINSSVGAVAVEDVKSQETNNSDVKQDDIPQVSIQFTESEQNHTRLRSGSRIRKRTIKMLEAEGVGIRSYKRNRNTEKLNCTHEGCDKVFYSEGQLFVHKRGVHEGLEDPMKCQDCDKVFAKSTQLLIHHRTHTGESPFSCTMCDAKFKAKCYLQQHMKLHDGPNVCTKCGKRCASRQALEIHATSHTQDRPFVCEICGTSYKSNQYLLNHQANHHAGLIDRPPIQCPTCLKFFSSASALRCHRLSAHGEGSTQFPCEVCGSIWNSQREHDKHYNVVHMNIRTVECSECSKKFSNRSNLRMHVLRHHSMKEERPRPFQCENCGKAFHLKATLENHIKIHSGQKPFPCPQCDKRFPSKSYLDLHIYTIHENRKRKTQPPEGHQPKVKKPKESSTSKKRSSFGNGKRKINVVTAQAVHHHSTIYTLQPVIEENVTDIGADTEIITLTPVSTTDGILNLISTERYDGNPVDAQNVVTFYNIA